MLIYLPSAKTRTIPLPLYLFYASFSYTHYLLLPLFFPIISSYCFFQHIPTILILLWCCFSTPAASPFFPFCQLFSCLLSYIPSSHTADLHSHFFRRLFSFHPFHTFIHPAFPFLIPPCLSLGSSPDYHLDSRAWGQGREVGPRSLFPVNSHVQHHHGVAAAEWSLHNGNPNPTFEHTTDPQTRGSSFHTLIASWDNCPSF